MSALLDRLKPNQRRGSKPRCHFLAQGNPGEVASRLSALVHPFASVSEEDKWMPKGFEITDEAELHRTSELLDPSISAHLKDWWLAPSSREARTPNFDIASTCTIGGRRGLLLVEAKAHEKELTGEAIGRRLEKGSSEDRVASHSKIGAAIESAKVGLGTATSQQWGISRDSHYQISNRFAWAWKLTEQGVPVALVYLGFLNCIEMADIGRPFSDHDDWVNVVLAHSKDVVPAQIWGQRLMVNGQALVPVIASMQQPLTEIHA